MSRYAIVLHLLPLLLLSACIQHKQLVNFNEGPAFESLNTVLPASPVRLQPGDLLEISILSTDPLLEQPFQTPGEEAGMYRLNAQGFIQIPLLGPVLLAGLREMDAQDTLSAKLGKFLKQPIVHLRMQSFRFTVLGEVARAGTFTPLGDQINVLEALGMAGDITPYGNREKVIVIRQRAGQRTFGILNLRNRGVFDSPYFYLQPGDVVYVEPLKAKVGVTADTGTKVLQWALPMISLASLLVALFN
jgi:polysaccharide export outer membrane protein